MVNILQYLHSLRSMIQHLRYLRPFLGPEGSGSFTLDPCLNPDSLGHWDESHTPGYSHHCMDPDMLPVYFKAGYNISGTLAVQCPAQLAGYHVTYSSTPGSISRAAIGFFSLLFLIRENLCKDVWLILTNSRVGVTSNVTLWLLYSVGQLSISCLFLEYDFDIFLLFVSVHFLRMCFDTNCNQV